MKRFYAALCALIALSLMLSCTACAEAAVGYEDYAYLLGSMEVVNVKTYTKLLDRPDAYGVQVARVPAGAVVTNCYYYDDKYTYCEYDGYAGYVLTKNLSFIAGPVGYEYSDEYYMGNYMIVNCASYAPLLKYPKSNASQVLKLPYGALVTNVYYQNDNYYYCVYGDMEGYVSTKYLKWISGGTAQATGDFIGTAVIVNCASYASLRAAPDTSSARLAKVPYGATVTNTYIVSDRFAYCEYNGYAGYILLDNLGW